MGSPRTVLVSPERLPGWVDRFAAGNGGLVSTPGHDAGTLDSRMPNAETPDAETLPRGGLLLRGANGCTAALYPPRENPDPGSRADLSVESLIASATSEDPIGLLLVRRGGYAAGVAEGGKLIVSKTGTKYVQSRTAAGGWSQQRFARRRANQASGLADAAAAHAARLFGEHPPACLQLGGDRTLAAETLANPVLRRFRELPQLKFLVVPDPRLDILKQAAGDARCIRITITDP